MQSRDKQRFIYFILALFCLFNLAVSADCQYEVRPHVNNSSALVNTTGADGTYASYWDIPLNVKVLDLLVGIIVVLGAIKLIPFIYGKIKNVLSNSYRKSMFLYVSDSPGSTVPAISKDMDMNLGTAKYHANILERAGKIIIKKVGKYLRLYPSGIGDEKEKLVISYYKNPTARSILTAIDNTPGITNGELAVMHDVKKSSIHWYIERFLEDGLISSRREGRNIRYYLTEDTKKILLKLAPILEKG